MSEASEVKRMKGKPTPNSGRGQNKKADAILDNAVTVDVKEFSKSFSLSRSVWAKVCSDAFRNGHHVPALNVILGEGGEKVRLWVIGEDMWEDMYELWKEKYVDGSSE